MTLDSDETYEPLFWDLETTGFDIMDPPPWVHDDHTAIIAIGFGWFDGDWRETYDWDAVDIDYEVTTLKAVNGRDSKNDIFSAEHLLLEKTFGMTGIMGSVIQDIELDGHRVFMTGWNTRNFDHTFAGGRLARHRLDNFPVGHQRKRLDMMRPASKDCGKTPAVSEDDYLDYLGMENDDDFTGADMVKEFGAGNIDNIRSHCESDVIQMMEVFWRKRRIMMKEFYDHYDIDRKIGMDNPIEF